MIDKTGADVINLGHGIAVVALSLIGCTSSVDQNKSSITTCHDPRPQVCTMIYAPVCGLASDESRKTYASDCTACSNIDVAGYERGECSK